MGHRGRPKKIQVEEPIIEIVKGKRGRPKKVDQPILKEEVKPIIEEPKAIEPVVIEEPEEVEEEVVEIKPTPPPLPDVDPELLMLVRLGNRLSWFFCIAKDHPKFNLNENNTIGELQEALNKAYDEHIKLEAERAEAKLRLSGPSNIK